jgi:hypothetical protein
MYRYVETSRCLFLHRLRDLKLIQDMFRLSKVWSFTSLAAPVLLLTAISAQASIITFDIAGMAQAIVTTGTNTVTIQLTDLVVNPGADTANVSAFSFTLNSTPTSASIAGSSAQEVTVAGPGYTLGSTVAPGWALTLVGATTKLDVLAGTGHAGPAETLIGGPGSGGYTNANGSLTSGSHNPYLYETASWTLTEMGVTAATTVASTVFQFGTADGVGQQAGAVYVTPEPSTFAMLGCAGVLLGLANLRRKSTIR